MTFWLVTGGVIAAIVVAVWLFLRSEARSMEGY
jgi:hypothetical protein